MNKVELVEKLALVAEISKTDAKKYLESVIDVFTSELAEGGEINLIGFGKFSVVDRPAREGRNPSTGEAIQIEASKNPKFKAGSKLKSAVNV